MFHDLQPTIELAAKFLIIALPVILVLWLISQLLGDTIGDFFAGFAKEVREFSVLDPTPSSLNLIGGMAMFAALIFFSRSIEIAIFSPRALNGEISVEDIALALCGAMVIGAYFLMCIRANRRTP
jgi:hypothetical protein